MSDAPLQVLALTAHPDNSIAEIRIGQPFRVLAAEGKLTFHLIAVKACKLRDVLAAQVVIVQREATPDALKWALIAQQLGKPLVYELDDLLTHPEPHLQQFETLMAHVPRVHRLLSLADCISVSTPRLLKALPTAVQQRGRLVPNAATPATHLPSAHTDVDDHHPLTLVIASSDALGARELTEGLCAWQQQTRRPHQILAVGPASTALKRVLKHVQAHPVMGLSAFRELLLKQPNPVGLIPLAPSPFNACKSAVKFMDYTAWGVTVIASDTPPYADVMTHGRHGWLVTPHAAAWQQAIEQLAESATRRTACVQQAQALVAAQYTLQHTADAWWALLTELPRTRPGHLPWHKAHWHIQHEWLQSLKQRLRAINERRKRARAHGDTPPAA